MSPDSDGAGLGARGTGRAEPINDAKEGQDSREKSGIGTRSGADTNDIYNNYRAQRSGVYKERFEGRPPPR